MIQAPTPVVSVVMPVRNEEDSVTGTLRSLLRQTCQSLEILVIDGQSDDDTVAAVTHVAATDPRVRLLSNPDRSIPQALEIGLRAARGRYLARIDAPAVVSHTYLERGVTELETHPDVAAIGGPRIGVGTGRTGRAIAAALASPFGVGNPLGAGNPLCVVRADVLRSIGGWNEDPLTDAALVDDHDHDRDHDLVHRIILAGWRVRHDPHLEIFWQVRRTLHDLARHNRSQGRARADLIRKRGHSAVRLRELAAPGLVTWLAVAALAAGIGQPWIALGMLLAVLIGLTVATVLTRKQGYAGRRLAARPLLGAFAAMHLGWGWGFLEGYLLRLVPAAVASRDRTGPAAGVTASGVTASGVTAAPRGQLRNVQGLRALAALLVVFVHMSGSSGFEARYLGSSWTSWLNVSANSGVDLFFVISGFIMIVTTWKSFDAPGAPLRFLWRRATRIYPLYWLVTTPILLLFLVSPTSVNSHADHPPSIVASYLLLPQQGLPLLLVGWTLVYELYFYLLFALGMLLGRRWFGWLIAGWSALTLTLHLTLPSSANPYLGLISSPMNLEFVFGSVIGYALVKGWLFAPRRLFAVGVLAVAGLFAALGRSQATDFPSEQVRVFGFGLAMAVVVYGAVGLEVVHGWRCPAVLQRWGGASYSLYLIHVPVLTALGMVLAKVVSPTPLVHAIGLVAVPGFLLGCALLLYRFAESPLQKFFHRDRRRTEVSLPSAFPAPVSPGM